MKRLAIILLTIVAMFGVPDAYAQAPSMDEMLEQVDSETKKVDKSPIDSSTVSAVNLKVHWRLWKRVYGASKPGTDELEALRHDGWSVGWVQQPQYAMAVAALAPALEAPADVNAAFEAAQELAPKLPYPYLLQASYALMADPADVPTWARAWGSGLRAGVFWPDTSFPWALKLLTYLLLALTVASFVFVLGQLIRNFSIAAYDFARVMPRGFSSSQTAVLLVAIVVVPGLVLASPLVSILTTLALVSFVQRPNERVVTAIVFGLIAALPFADQALTRVASYPGSITQTMTEAQWVHCATGCQEELNELAVRHADDPYIRYSALLAAYREGGDANMKRVIEEVESFEWPGEIIGYAHNLQGAAYVVLAKPKKAEEALNKARDEIRTEAAPAFNLMRAHQLLEDGEQASAALEEATARDLDAVTRFLGLERRDSNSYLMAVSLPLEMFPRYHMTQAPDRPEVTSVIEPFWKLLSGDAIEFERATLIGIAGIALLLLGIPLRRRTSTPCPRCGLARDPNDRSKTANHPYCMPCYSTFITGATLDYDARVHNEKVLGRRESAQRLVRRLGGLIAPGLGHHTAGHAGAGFTITAIIVFSIAILLRPHGIVRATHELVATNWSGQVTIAWLAGSVCVLILVNIALRDIEPVGGWED